MSAATAWRLPDAFGTPVAVRRIERELSSQLLELRADKAAPAQRVRMSNLVIYTDRMDTAGQIADQLLDIASVHPARVLLLIADPEADSRELTASVRVQCRSLSKQQQACSEQVTLHVPAALADRLPFAVRALLIGDLPVNLWWASTQPPPFAGTILYELGELAQQVIYDSVGWLEPARGVAATATWLDRVEVAEPGRWRVASDLNWRRLKYWRRLVSQALDPSVGEGSSMKEMTVEHGPHAVVQGYELTAWLALRLGWRLADGRT